MPELRVAASELVLGGPRSGKSARAEALAASWLAAQPGHRAIYIATAQPWDAETADHLARRRDARAQRLPALPAVEEPLELARAIGAHSRADTLVVVDCLTLWLTARLLPAVRLSQGDEHGAGAPPDHAIANAIARAAGPLVLVSNEGGIAPPAIGADSASFAEALARLNQQAALACERVTLMVAGLPLTLKDLAA